MTVTLRAYQSSSVAKIADEYKSGKKSVVFCLSTGGGKTVTFSHIAQRAAERGNRTCILVHRRELLDQASGSLVSLGVEHARISAGSAVTMDAMVHVASVQTLARRLDTLPADYFRLLIVDECHHSNAGTWEKVINHFSSAKLLGVSATPIRTDGRGLGEYYDSMVHGPDPVWLTENGFLAPAKYYAPPCQVDAGKLHTLGGDYRMDEAAAQMGKAAVMGDVIEHYRRFLPGGTAIAFCCSIKHAESTAAAFNEAGIVAASIDGRMDTETRRGLLDDLGSGAIKVLTSASLVGEGVDVPSVNGCIMLRPTMSVGWYLQMVGRCLRPSPGKQTAVIIDHVGNALRHGFHTDHREWSLEGKPKRSSDAPSVRVCVNCYAANPSVATHCCECGHEFPVQTAAEIAQVAGELQELAPKGLRPGDTVQWRGKVWYIASHPRLDQVSLSDTKTAALALARGRGNHYDMRHVAPLSELVPTTHKPRRPSAGASSYEELLAIEKQRGYKPGWARHIYAARQRR